jgi:hypothetical protein
VVPFIGIKSMSKKPGVMVHFSIPALGRLRQKYHNLEVSLGYIDSCLKNKKIHEYG